MCSISNWTEHQTNELRRLRALGYSFALIGEQFGRTEDACVSRADRIGMRVQSPAKAPKSTPTFAANGPDVIGAAPSGRKLKTLLELTASSCRWPFGDPKDKDFGFCGCQSIEGRPYCAEHFALSHSHLHKIKRHTKRTRTNDRVMPKDIDRWAA